MEIVFIGLALSVCCFGIWRYGKTLRRGGCCGSGMKRTTPIPQC